MTTAPICTCGQCKVPDIGYTGKCPSCGNDLQFELTAGGSRSRHLVCPNIDCAGATLGLMLNWVRTHEIRGFGRTVISSLITEGDNRPDKLYTADVTVFAKAANSDKTGAKLYNNLKATKKMRLARFLTGLNISALGDTNGKLLAKRFNTLDGVMGASERDISAIQGIKTKAKLIRNELDHLEPMIRAIEAVVEIEDFTQAGPLAGKSFAMTGLRNHNGVSLEEVIESHGGEVKSSVGKGLDYLIILDPKSTSVKANKARSLGTVLISPDEFMEMVE